jgi:hypothetical protein
VRTLVLAELAAGSSSYVVSDLSEAGAWIEGGPLVSVGEELLLRLLIPSETPRSVEVRARVVRSHSSTGLADDASLNGLGLAFTGLSPDAERALQEALHGLPPPLPLVRFVAPVSRDRSPATPPRTPSRAGLMSMILAPSA